MDEGPYMVYLAHSSYGLLYNLMENVLMLHRNVSLKSHQQILILPSATSKKSSVMEIASSCESGASGLRPVLP